MPVRKVVLRRTTLSKGPILIWWRAERQCCNCRQILRRSCPEVMSICVHSCHCSLMGISPGGNPFRKRIFLSDWRCSCLSSGDLIMESMQTSSQNLMQLRHSSNWILPQVISVCDEMDCYLCVFVSCSTSGLLQH